MQFFKIQHASQRSNSIFSFFSSTGFGTIRSEVVGHSHHSATHSGREEPHGQLPTQSDAQRHDWTYETLRGFSSFQHHRRHAEIHIRTFWQN